ncbi:MAG: hypothetical protein M1831_005146 [Alyxoria varia]|nr:MAG: hypothetical protein M1831_005146 [Alyxoria varia]
MAASPSMSPPGTSTYSSNTLHVGDGTWNDGRDTFLLPNVVGLNFDTMRYNGMGNRFRDLPGYHNIIVAHGVIAAITFIGIVPAAILTASFYHRNPYLALRIHIGLQVFTVFLTTVIFVLGYFAVGPERSLTNPHHGIGLTIYLLVLVQAFGGWLVKRMERGKIRYYLPLKIMLHQWVGRGIALLALAQIPIGLTLYGSPRSLFVLYALAVFALVATYFILVHRNHKRVGAAFDERESFLSATQSDYTDDKSTAISGPPEARRHRLEEMAGAVGLGAAVAALRRRSSGRHRRADSGDDALSVAPSSAPQPRAQPPAQSYMSERFTESDYSEPPRRSWRDRLVGPAAGVGGLLAARRFFNRRKEKEDDAYYERSPGPPLGGAVSHSALDVDTVEEGRTMGPSDHDWRRVEDRERAQQAAMERADDLHTRLTGESFESDITPEKPTPPWRRFGLPGASKTGGGLGRIGSLFKRKRERKEDERIEAERIREEENERMFGRRYIGGDGIPRGPSSSIREEEHGRMYGSNNGPPRYTGDGTPRRPGGRIGSNSPLTELTERTGSPNRSRAGERSLIDGDSPQRVNIPPPPRSIRGSSRPSQPQFSSASPSSGRGRRQNPDFNNNPNVTQESSPISPPPAATAATGSLLSPPPPPHSGNRTHSASPHEGVGSPPVSVKVKMHDDGRHVTLRRLGEEEAARERENRRREHGRQDNDLEENDTQRFRRGPGTPYTGPSQQTQPGLTPPAQQHPSDLQLPQQATPGVSPPSALEAGGMGSSPNQTGTATDRIVAFMTTVPLLLLALEASLATAQNVVTFDLGRRNIPPQHAPKIKRDTVAAKLGNANYLYYANITVGTPGQLLQLQIDSGSSDVWMTATGDEYCQESYNACVGGTFDAEQSSTYKRIKGQPFEISYVDGSGSSGNYFTDNMSTGGVSLDTLQMGLATKTSIGTGILGVGFAANEAICNHDPDCDPYPTLTQQLVKQKKINSQAYSLWLNDLDANSGSILFGGVDSSKYTGSLVTLPVEKDTRSDDYTSFTVAWTGFSVGTPKGEENQFVPQNFAQPAILDSGTSTLLFPDDLAQKLYDQFGATFSQEADGAIAPCYLRHANATLDFQFGGDDGPTIKAPIDQFLLDVTDSYGEDLTFDNGDVACQLGFEGAQGRPLLLGDTFLRSAYVVYDLDNKQISIAQADFSSRKSDVREIRAGRNGVPGVSRVADFKGVTATSNGADSYGNIGATVSAVSVPSGSLSEGGKPPLAEFTTAAAAPRPLPSSTPGGFIVFGLFTTFAVVGAAIFLI